MKKLFLFLISFYAFGQDNINSEFNNLELSRIDERFAQILNSFFLGLSRGEYDKKVLLALNSLVDRSDAFNDFRDLVNLSATLNCNDLIKNPHNQSSKFGNKWVNELKKYCRIQILTRITQGKLEKEEEDLFFTHSQNSYRENPRAPLLNSFPI